ncbi:MAG: hypothetical protein L0Z62_35865 [Gemmataceae bacterium]|nr:hypothetical protein [Gemmataceae bacterium]
MPRKTAALPADVPLAIPDRIKELLAKEEAAQEAQLAFELEKAERRRRAREEAERRARHCLPRQHPLSADQPLVRQMVMQGYVSWNAVQRMRELRQGPGWSLKDIAELFGVRVSFVALATSHLDLNTIDVPKVVDWDTTNTIAYTRSRKYSHPADGVHFGCAYSEPAYDTGGYTDQCD